VDVERTDHDGSEGESGGENGKEMVAAGEATISLALANVVALALFPGTYLFFVRPYQQLWSTGLIDHLLETEGPGLPLLAAGMLLSILVHELLHLVGFLAIGRAPWSAVRIGVSWKALAPYAHCHQPMTARAYRISVALPGLLLGLLPAIIGLLFGSPWILLWGSVMIIAAGGDLAVLLAMFRVPVGTMVRDHPSKAGCVILEQRA